MDNLLVVPNFLKASLHHIHALIRMGAHSEYAPEHLEEAKVRARGGGGTTTVRSARRSHNSRRRSGEMMSHPEIPNFGM
jgi:hypothetical protein